MSEKHIAVIGAGYWGKNLVRNFDQLGVLKTICDDSRSVREELAKAYPSYSLGRPGSGAVATPSNAGDRNGPVDENAVAAAPGRAAAAASDLATEGAAAASRAAVAAAPNLAAPGLDVSEEAAASSSASEPSLAGTSLATEGAAAVSAAPGRPGEGLITSNLADILEDDEITGVVIAAPAARHFDLARQALQAGKHVYVEKPLAMTYAEGEAIVRLAAAKGKTLFVGHILHYHAAVIRLKEMIRAGKIGRLQYIYSRRLSLGKIRREENILWSFAPHDISLILGLTGEEPCFVDSVGNNFLHARIPDVTMTNLKFPSGIGAHIFVSWLNPYKEQKLVVVGSSGMLVFDDTAPVEQKLVLYPHTIHWQNGLPVPNKADSVAIDLRDIWEEPLKAECRAFLAAMTDGIPPLTSGEEGLRVLKVLEASQQSLERKEWINAGMPSAAAASGDFSGLSRAASGDYSGLQMPPPLPLTPPPRTPAAHRDFSGLQMPSRTPPVPSPVTGADFSGIQMPPRLAPAPTTPAAAAASGDFSGMGINGAPAHVFPAPVSLGKASGPFEDVFLHPTAIVDDNVAIGKGTKIWHFTHILSGVVIGANCNIGQNVVIGPEVVIGDRCKIQNNVSVYKGVTLEEGVFCGPSMVFTNIYNPRAEIGKMDQVRPTLVKRGATLGANCTIVCGHAIGRYAFIGAGAVVTKDVPDHALIVGNPARRIGWVCECGERLPESLKCPACGKSLNNVPDSGGNSER